VVAHKIELNLFEIIQMRINTKADKGVAGLTILLSLVTMLFVIGLIVMIFSLMGGELRDATYTTTSATVTNETGFYLNGTTYTVTNADAQDFASFVVTNVVDTFSNVTLLTGNYTVGSAGTIVNATADANVSNEHYVSYTYVYGAENTATGVINDTTGSIATVTDWFDIFIVIGAMVVLILLTVIIITAIRGSGLMDSGGA